MIKGTLIGLVVATCAQAESDDLHLPPRALWRIDAGHHTLGRWHPLLDADFLVVPGSFEVLALASDDGAERWRAPLETAPRVAALSATGDQLAIGALAGRDARGVSCPDLHVLDPMSGRRRWSIVAGGVFATPVWADERLVIASTQALLAVDAADGCVGWRVDFPRDDDGLPTGPAEAGPVVAGGLVVTGTIDGRLLAFELDTGTPRWSRKLERRLFAKPAAAAGGEMVVCASGDTLAAFATRDGACRWRRALAGPPLIAAPVISDGTIYIATGAGQSVVALHAADGALLWETPLGAACYGQPALTRTMLWIGDFAGTLVALARASGAVLWQGQLAEGQLSDPVVDGPRLVIGGEGGVLCMLAPAPAEDRVLPVTSAELRIAPNPAREEARLWLGGTARAIDIFDVHGRRVRRLPGGESVTVWDLRDSAGRRLPSGIYFARVNGDGTERAAKIELVR